MAILTPNAALGRTALTSMTLTPQTVAANGTLSDGTSQSVLATVERFQKSQRNTLENITAITQRRINNVIVETGSSYTINGFYLANDSIVTPTNLVNAVVQAADIVKLVFAFAGVTETFYGVVEEYSASFAKGKCEFTLTIEMIDPNAVNPSQA